MSEQDFDARLVEAAFALGAEQGWARVTQAAAARRAGLDLADARGRFGMPGGILRKFGELADRHALAGAASEGPVRDRLFDILMRRFDFLQSHRDGVVALLKFLPRDPPLAMLLARANLTSMGWLLEAAGVSAGGFSGALARRGLLVVWALGMRAWLQDDSADLTGTMAAVDTALNRADQIATRFAAAPVMRTQTDAAEMPGADAPFETPELPDLPFPEAPSGLA